MFSLECIKTIQTLEELAEISLATDRSGRRRYFTYMSLGRGLRLLARRYTHCGAETIFVSLNGMHRIGANLAFVLDGNYGFSVFLNALENAPSSLFYFLQWRDCYHGILP